MTAGIEHGVDIAREGALPTVSVIIPVYFNAESLPELFARLSAQEEDLVRNHTCLLEYVFVDDGSKDTSFDELLHIYQERSNVKVIRLSRNFGGVNAIKIGLRNCSGDAAIIMAADLQDPPELISEMIQAWLRGRRFVICERRSRVDSGSVRLTSGIYHWVLRKLILETFPSGGFDMLLIDRLMIDYLKVDAKSMYPQVLAFWLGFEPAVIQYDRPPRPFGRSRWSASKRINAFANILFGYSVFPIQLATAIGALVALVSISYAALLVALRLLGQEFPAGFSVLAALTAFLSGLILLTLGVLGQYVWRIYDQISGRPDAVVDIVLSPNSDKTPA